MAIPGYTALAAASRSTHHHVAARPSRRHRSSFLNFGVVAGPWPGRSGVRSSVVVWGSSARPPRAHARATGTATTCTARVCAETWESAVKRGAGASGFDSDYAPARCLVLVQYGVRSLMSPNLAVVSARAVAGACSVRLSRGDDGVSKLAAPAQAGHLEGPEQRPPGHVDSDGGRNRWQCVVWWRVAADGGP